MPSKKKDEVRIEDSEDDYEMVPISPMRKMEKKISSLESSNYARKMELFTDKLFDITELNQKIIDDVVRSNQSLREDLAVLIGKIENLTKKMDGFMDLMNQAMEIDTTSSEGKEAMEILSKPIVENMKVLVDNNRETSEMIMHSLNDISKTIRRSQFSHISPSMSNSILSRRKHEESDV